MTVPEGTKIGHYEVRSLLGAGGMGEVYLAQDLKLQRAVAIKVLRADLTADRQRMLRFEREAHTASNLNHPNILTIFEIRREDDAQFIVTEFIDGESLRDRLRREAIPVREILEIGIQVASALSAAHEAGVVHRDIKPDNIMLRRDRLVKVVDFGLAKLVEQEADPETESPLVGYSVTEPGTVLGTAPFMSPEQVRAMPLDARTDIWSLGVVLYRMVTGHLPFDGKTTSDTLAEILKGDAPPLATYVPDVQEELSRILMKTLRKDREERYQTAEELGRDLKSLKQQVSFGSEVERSLGRMPRTGEIMSYTHSQTSGSMSAGRRGKPIIWLVLAALVLAGAVGAYFLFWRSSVEPADRTITSLAILPFKNLSSQPGSQSVGDGISEGLAAQISQRTGLKVIGGSSTAMYGEVEFDPHEVAQALGVDGIVTGRIAQRGELLTVNVELIDGRDRTQVWGEQYERKAGDVAAVQAEISRAIAERLRQSR